MRKLSVAVAAAGLLAMTGCSEYLDRRETIAMWAGDAQQANLVSHAVHPIPRHAAWRDLSFHGERMQRAQQRYRTNTVYQPATNMGSGAISAPVAAGTAGAGG